MTQHFQTLISAAELRALMDAAASGQAAAPLVIIDTSFDLADTAAGERGWRAGHVLGALYLHLDRDLSAAKTGRNGRHPLPDRSTFARTLGRCGITNATQVIALDGQGGMYAARLWWMLRWMGHADVAVLDGGPAAWVAAGGALVAGPAEAPAGAVAADAASYPTREPLAATIDADTLARQLGARPLIDARAAERFRGDVEPLDAAAGHIPGALNRFFKDNLDGHGRFKPAAELRAAFEPLLGGRPASDLIHQCGSGVTACHNLLAMEHAGLSGSVLYPGSWSEWSSDATRPVARG